MIKTSTVTEKLRYKFTPEEHRKNTDALVTKMGERAEMTENHDAIKASLKEQEKRVDAEVMILHRLCRDGFDMRDVDCEWKFNEPAIGQKTLRRSDTNEAVRTMIMLDHERQELLKLEMPSHVLVGPASLKGKRVVEITDEDISYWASRDESDLLKFGWVKGDIDAVFEEARRRAEEKEKAAGDKVTQFPASAGPQLVPDAVEGTETAQARSPETAPPEATEQPEGEAVEPANTLPSVRAMAGGTTAEAKQKRGRRRSHEVVDQAQPQADVEDEIHEPVVYDEETNARDEAEAAHGYGESDAEQDAYPPPDESEE